MTNPHLSSKRPSKAVETSRSFLGRSSSSGQEMVFWLDNTCTHVVYYPISIKISKSLCYQVCLLSRQKVPVNQNGFFFYMYDCWILQTPILDLHRGRIQYIKKLTLGHPIASVARTARHHLQTSFKSKSRKKKYKSIYQVTSSICKQVAKNNNETK